MDTWTLSLVIAIVSAAVAVLMVLFAAYRRKRTSVICAGGFVAGSLCFLLFLLPGGDHRPELLLPANALLVGQFLAMIRALREELGWPVVRPRRLWVYLPVGFVALVYFALVQPDYRGRVTVMTVVLVLLLAELLVALGRKPAALPRIVRNAARVVALGHAICHLVRLGLTLGLEPGTRHLVTNNQLSNFTFVYTLVFAVLWAGVMFIIEVAHILDELEQKNRAMEELAVTDELTGLFNRHQLDIRLDAECERARRYDQPLSLVMLDVDHFKKVNDTWGHQTGDQVLIAIAGLCRSCIREPDNIFRWGGEEFLILAPHTDVGRAVIMAEKIRAAIAAQDLPVCGPVNASFGVAQWHPEENREVWFRQVDQALYRAKETGRNKVVAFGMNEQLAPALVRLVWQRAWESGNMLVDDEHCILLELGNHLLDLALSQAGVAQLLEAFDILAAHVTRHFQDEETILAAVEYPELAEHHRIHGQLVAETMVLRDRLAAGGMNTGTLVNYLVGSVINGHLLKVDVKFFPWTRGEAHG